MKQQLQAKQSQQLALTPQLRQSLHLLQMSALELDAEIARVLEENPLLDWIEESESLPDADQNAAVGETIQTTSDVPVESPDQPLDSISDWASNKDIAWEHSGGSGSGQTDDDDDDDSQRGERIAAQETLHEHLMWQLRMSQLSLRAQAIGEALIDGIDDDGYLRESFDGIRDVLEGQYAVDDAEIESVLQQIQVFDPVGSGARSLSECLSRQLDLLDGDATLIAHARTLCNNCLERLPKIGLAGIAKTLACDETTAQAVLELLRTLDPKPGSAITPLEADTYVVPDAVIWREQGVWRSALTGHSVPRVGIHQAYVRMMAQASREDAGYMREHLQEARWILRGIEARGETLLSVTRCLAREQSAFLEFGEMALRPLTLRAIAQKLDLHESTVSRAIARKYIRTPRGTIAMRSFFASGIESDAGETSSAAIQTMIRELIDKENPRKPLSDAALTKHLNDTGVPVARRTVAKYREAIGLPASSDRMRLA
ncbi:RNA polymerase factor sigma-54 [Lysobacter sp. HDW10]|uniref:RNA polymerase factor sigma-54 n=1 Tax=Lysobacter sp. HDW10 TaxID=2714936 RepID=UPI00140828F0|nr:RNA polymerase factor sigma-54 [Lysobacter sp. HDW10]QIK80288.1 RNA polymerase factor sigma-54 [Lysobacter sp. HDW10]